MSASFDKFIEKLGEKHPGLAARLREGLDDVTEDKS